MEIVDTFWYTTNSRLMVIIRPDTNHANILLYPNQFAGSNVGTFLGLYATELLVRTSAG